MGLRLLVLSATGTLIMLGPAAAQESPSYDINIPAEPLGDALNALAQQSGLQVLFSSHLVAKLRSPELKGSLTAQEALRRLLENTGLRFEFVNAHTVAIPGGEPAGPRDADHGTSAKETAKDNSISSDRSRENSADKNNLSGESSMSHRSLLARLLGVLAICGSAAHTGSTCAQSPSSGPPTEGATAETGQVEEVVVTAQKRKENLQDVPIALTVLSPELLRQNSFTSLADLQSYAPSLTFSVSPTDPVAPIISLRGQASQRVDIGRQSSVGLYFDGVYASNAAGALASGSLLDVERIEVLNGPQGTLYGRNTPGGAVNIITKLPTDRFEGTLRAVGGNLNLFGGDVIINLPVAASAAVRISAQIRQDHGYGLDISNNVLLGNQRLQAYRASLLLHPSDQFRMIFRGDYSRDRTGGDVWRLVALAPGATLFNKQVAAQLGLPNTPAGLTQARLAALATVPANPYHNAYDPATATDFGPFTGFTVSGVSMTSEYDFSDAAQLKGISAYRHLNRPKSQDSDATPFQIICCNFGKTDLDQLSQEFQINNEYLNHRLKSVAGLYLYYSNASESNNYGITPAVLGNFAYNYNYGTNKDSNGAIYDQLTYAINDRFNAAGGLRLTREQIEFSGNNFSAAGCSIPVAYRVSGVCLSDNTARFTNLSWSGGLDYHVSSAAMIYAKISRGFKAGGFNTQGPPLPFRPETATVAEAGSKVDWFDHRLRLDGDVYYTWYNNIQRSVNTVIPGGSIVQITTNAGKAHIEGVEATVTAALARYVEIRESASYTLAQYDAYIDAKRGDLSGDPFPNVPKWQVSTSVSGTIPAEFGSLTLSAKYYWQSFVDLAPDDHSPYSGITGLQPSYGLLDARAALSISRLGLELALYGKNLTNQLFILGASDTTGSLGGGSNVLGPPRTYGVELTKQW